MIKVTHMMLAGAMVLGAVATEASATTQEECNDVMRSALEFRVEWLKTVGEVVATQPTRDELLQMAKANDALTAHFGAIQAACGVEQ